MAKGMLGGFLALMLMILSVVQVLSFELPLEAPHAIINTGLGINTTETGVGAASSSDGYARGTCKFKATLDQRCQVDGTKDVWYQRTWINMPRILDQNDQPIKNDN